MGEISQFISLVGLPVFLILMVGYGGWRAGVWAAPRFDSIFEAHKKYLQVTGDAAAAQAITLQEHAVAIKDHSSLLREIRNELRGIPCRATNSAMSVPRHDAEPTSKQESTLATHIEKLPALLLPKETL